MKKILFLITLSLLSLTASAQYMHWQSRYAPYHSGGGGWIAPVIIGGVIGYSINRAQQPNTIIIQQPSVTVENNMECSAWRETQQPDGTIKRERICYQR